MTLVYEITLAAWKLLEQSALYILLGLLVGGLLKIFLSPDYVAKHLGKGKISSVFKAALLGVPIPLCSCGVLPAAAQLKRQGANNGATAAFLISTPESGVDSIALSWALLDPIMTVARPVAAFFSAFIAGLMENFFSYREGVVEPLLPLKILPLPGNACQEDCSCAGQAKKGELRTSFKEGMQYAITDIWGDLAGWFFVGIVIAACITVLVPDDLIARHLGGGIGSMFLMLLFGIPMYICATASTPIAAALIIKGVSPGTALVFLLTGPATNITALAVIINILGKKGTVLYLVSLSVISVLCGLILDALYFSLGISAVATIGTVTEALPDWLMLAATCLLLLFSTYPLHRWLFRSGLARF